MSDASSFGIQYKDKPDHKGNFNEQTRRCLQLAGTDMFPDSVEALARVVPIASYMKLISRRKEWVTEEWKFEYMYSGPIKIGSVERPIMAKLPDSNTQRYPIPFIMGEDGEPTKDIDWDDPNILSPRLIQKDEPNYLTFFHLIMEEAQYAGLTWQTDITNSVRKP